MRKIVITVAVLALAGCSSAASTPKAAAPTAAAAASPTSASLCTQLIAWRDAHGDARLHAVGRTLLRWSTDVGAHKYADVLGHDSTALAKAATRALASPPPGPAEGPYTAAMTYLSSGATDAESARGEPLSEAAGSITAAADAFQQGNSQLTKATTDLTSSGCG